MRHMDTTTTVRRLLPLALFCIVLAGAMVLFALPVAAQSSTSGADIVVSTVPDSSISQAIVDRVATSWPWYVTRASGLIAALLLFILMLSGVGFITGRAYRFLEPLTAWATHRALGIALLVAVVVHVGSLYFDHFVHFTIADLFIPFVSDYRPVELLGITFGSLWVALGVLSLYVFVAIVFTSLFWIDKRPRKWKVIHVLSYLAVMFVFIHALYLGTDLTEGWLRVVWFLGGIILFFAAVIRLWRVGTV